MDISSPLRSLIPSLDSAVLEVLARLEGALSLAEIERLAARGSRAGLAAVLDRLVEHGLVRAQRANRGQLYSLNRDHILTEAILEAANARREVLRRIGGALRALEVAPVHASVFGSFARRDGSEASDIDLVLIFETDAALSEAEPHIDRLGEQVLAWTGNRLEVLALTASQVAESSDEAVLTNIAREGITVLGPPWTAVVDNVGAGGA